MRHDSRNNVTWRCSELKIWRFWFHWHTGWHSEGAVIGNVPFFRFRGAYFRYWKFKEIKLPFFKLFNT